MDQDQKWLAGLSGKKHEIAVQLLKGKPDQEIADHLDTSIEYIRKIKSDLRAHGYDIPDNRISRSNTTVSSGGSRGDVDGKIVVNDGITPELANAVYADLRAGMGNEEIADKRNLRGWQVVALRKERHLMNGCDAFSKIEQEFASEGPELLDLLRYMSDQKKTPKTLVVSLSGIKNLDEREKQLTDSIKRLTLEEQSKKQSVLQLSGQLKNIRNELDSIQQQIDEKLGENAQTQDFISERKIELENLNTAVAITKKKLGEDRAKTDSYVRSVVFSEAEKLLANKTLLWQHAFWTLIGTVRYNIPARHEFMELISNSIENSIDFELFKSKYLDLLGPYYHTLLEQVTARAYSTVIGPMR